MATRAFPFERGTKRNLLDAIPLAFGGRPVRIRSPLSVLEQYMPRSACPDGTQPDRHRCCTLGACLTQTVMRQPIGITLRFLRRHPGYTTINVAGLAIGLTAAFLIFLYVRDEAGYDRYHEHAESVFRLSEEQLDERGEPAVHRVMLDPAVGLLAKEKFPEVIQSARLTPVGPLLTAGNQHISCGTCYWADASLFDVLSFEFLSGDPATALVAPFSLVLTQTRAEALFGKEPAMGKLVLVNGEDAFTVTGVVADQPTNTHLPLDGVGSMASMEEWFGEILWDSPNYLTYIRLVPGADRERLEAKLDNLFQGQLDPDMAARRRLHLQPLRSIHLTSHLVGEVAENGDLRFVLLFGAVGLFLLLIACANFVNLATARSGLRAREVGVRKAIGAARRELVVQFIQESVLTTLIALAAALILLSAALPLFNSFTGKTLSLSDEWMALGVVSTLLLLVVGFGAGSYPALFLSAFKPIRTLSGDYGRGRGNARLRSVLVVTQFVIAIVLGFSTIVALRQLQFVQSRPLGYEQENILVMPTIWDLRERFSPLRDRLLQKPEIVSVTQSNPIPSSRLFGPIESQIEDRDGARLRSASLLPVWCDADFFGTYEVPFVAGRDFMDEFASDASTGFVLNETAVARLGIENAATAVDLPIRVGGWRGRILGVVRDFHFESLHEKVAPIVFYMDQRNYRLVSVRIAPGANPAEVSRTLQEEWKRYEPNSLASVSHLETRLQAAYEKDRRIGQLIAVFAALAVFVTCLGLFGLVSFSVEQRMRELGVRKALGATSWDLISLVGRHVLTLVAVALVIGLPAGALVSVGWLNSFAYHQSLSWWVVASLAGVTVAIALLTVSYQAIRAARANPVVALRHE
jgi:putative ABC transport system permease protein